MTRKTHAFVLFALLFGACAESPPPETQRPAVPVSVPSYLPLDATVVLRFDARTIRETAISDDVARMIAVSGTWSRLSAGSSVNPVNDVDIMLCGARASVNGGFYARSWYFVFRVQRTPEEVEAAIAEMAEINGMPARWQSRDGFRFAVLPIPSSGFTDHFVMPTANGEVVVAPLEDLDRIVAVARAQSQARRGDEAVDPWLVTQPNEMVYLRVDPRGEALSLELPPFRSFELLATNEAPRIGLRAIATYGSEAEAESARQQADVQRRQAADNTAARIFGLGHTLDTAEITTEGVSVRATALLDAGAARNLARLLTQAQQRPED